MKEYARYAIGAVVAVLVLMLFQKPDPLPPEVAIGTIVIPPKLWQQQLHDVGTRTGIEKVTRKEVKPTTHAVAPGAARSLQERYVAAAVDTAGVLAGRSLLGDSVTGNLDSIPAQPKDSVCVGAGGSIRKNELVLLSACAPGAVGTTDRYRGRSFDWSYESGKPVVSATRIPDLEWLWRALSFIGAVAVAVKVF